MLRSWLRGVRNRLVPMDAVQAQLCDLNRGLRKQDAGLEKIEKRVARQVERSETDLAEVSKSVSALSDRLNQRLEQQELLLRRLEYLIGNGAHGDATIAPVPRSQAPEHPRTRVPASARAESPASEVSDLTPSTLRRMAEVPSDVWIATRCPVCEGPEATLVCEWNKFVLLGGAPDDDAVFYDYSVCHSCGVLFAKRRPVGRRFRYMIENFVEATGKGAGNRELSNPLLNPYPLTDEDRAHLRTLIARGVFVSEHLRVSKREFLNGALKDRLENSVHVEILSSLVPLSAESRVLEIRPRAGSILAALKRNFGVEIYGIPIWESQRFIIKELYGIDSPGVIDFVDFKIPYERGFDLVLCNHMLTHALDPRVFFAEIREHLKPGGHLYLYNEPDDSEYLHRGQSMIATLNPFHMQAFDQRSLVRALAANGFETVFATSRELTHACLFRQRDDVVMEPMNKAEKRKRLRLYADARLRALLKLPEAARPRIDLDWHEISNQAVACGVATVGDAGGVRLVTPQR